MGFFLKKKTEDISDGHTEANLEGHPKAKAGKFEHQNNSLFALQPNVNITYT